MRAYFGGGDSYFFYNDGLGNFTGQPCLDVLGESCERGRASILGDINNDGYTDVIFNEAANPTSDTLKIYLNDSNTGYTLVDNQTFVGTWILRGLSLIDFDNDGFQDIYSPSSLGTEPNLLYRNNGNANNWLKVRLGGTQSNSAGVGSKVAVYGGGLERHQQVVTNSGLHSGNSYYLNFGMGALVDADSVVVSWPSGEKSILEDVAVNQTVEILELAVPVIQIDSIVTNAFQPAITGLILGNADVIEVELESVSYNAINNGDSTWVVPAGVVDSLFNGEYEVIARATNVAGVGVDTAILVIDQRAPLVTVDTLVTNERSPELTGTVNDVLAEVSVEIDKEVYIAINNLDSTWTLAAGRIDPPLEDGVYDVLVRGANDFGDSTDVTTNELRLDGTAPTLFVDNIGTSITSPELTGFIDDFTASFTVSVEGRGDFVPEVNEADSTWSILAGEITPGFTEADSPILIVATAEDSLANISIDSGQLIIANTIVALEASRVTTNSFRANWSDVLDAVNYTLEVSEGDDDFTTLAVSEDLLATSFDVDGLDFETDYFYRVTFDNGEDPPTTSDTIAVSTLILPETVADFEALLEISTATNASVNWDLAVRKQDWDSIVLEEERVVAIDLSSNTLENSFPLTRDLTMLKDLKLADNTLTGLDSLAKLRSIETIDVSENLLDFQDLEPLRELIGLTYSPQKTRLTFNEFNDTSDGGSGERSDGDSLKIRVFNDTTLSITTNGAFDRYEWFRENTPITTNEDFTISDSTLRINAIDFDNMGKFSAAVRNDSLPDLSIPVDSMFALAIARFSVDVNGTDGEPIPENVDGFLLLTEQRGAGFDTLSSALNQPSSFTIDSVILGDYLVSVDSDREKYIPTYYSNAFEWIEADTVMFRKDTAFQVAMTVIPEPPNPEEVGVLDVILEEDFGDDENARIETRRRAKRRKCGLRRRRTGGRQDEFELFAYGETDDNGEFQFGFLPEGVYRFFVEYPGIPLDPDAEVQFEVGEQGLSDTEFSLSAFTTENGVEVAIERVLGVIFEYFKDLKVYPNPASERVKIIYRHLKAKNVAARMVDLSGTELWSKDIRSGYDGYEEIDVSDYEEGIYLLYIYDKDNRNKNVVSYRIMVRK